MQKNLNHRIIRHKSKKYDDTIEKSQFPPVCHREYLYK